MSRDRGVEVEVARQRMCAGRPRQRHPTRWQLLALAWLALAARPAEAEPDSGRPAGGLLQIDPPPRLRSGEVGSLIVRVRVAGAGEQPLLLTPSVQGQALEVVRGRLLRADAVAAAKGELRFEVPVLAKLAGTALFRIELWTYRCERLCHPVQASASKLLEVRAPTARQ